MDKDGILFTLIPILGALAFAFAGFWILAGAFGLLAAFMLFFFRDPFRKVPADENAVLAAADGRVTRVEETAGGNLVSVFLSPFDVHINRAPVTGTVTDVTLTRGAKKPATSDSSSETNERNAVTIENAYGTFVCTQIVGVLARRIVCRAKQGDEFTAGQRFGLIRFGSRTDVLMPSNSQVLVGPGDRVRGGETVIARMKPVADD